MATRVGVEVSIGVADAVKLCRAEVVAAYPITPQTHIVEHLSELVANGDLDAAFIPVESEHSAMSCCLGSAAVGARTYTATAGQGLELMHEVLYVASSMRLPIIMGLANRALSGPLNVWGDHSDVMSCRDIGWIQIFVENGQEAIDHHICAFKIGEDPRVLLPVMISMDGFHLTHVIEPIMMPSQEEVDRFLPKFRYEYALRPDTPITMGDFAPPAIYTEARWAQERSLVDARPIIIEYWAEFAKQFGREYHPVETYHGDAKTLLFTMGSFSQTASLAIDELREKGIDVGQIKLRLWRPFPFEEFRAAVKDTDVIIILDRALSYGGPGGPVASEIRSALYQEPKRPRIVSFVGGLGGRDITMEQFETIVRRGMEIAEKGSENEFEIFGVRE